MLKNRDFSYALFHVKCLAFILFNFIIYKSQAQGFGNTLIGGTSLTYIPNILRENNITGREWFHELTWNVNAAIPLNRRFDAGLSGMFIRTWDKYRSASHKYMVGAFVQYDFWPDSRQDFYLESGLYTGNYCTCGNRMRDPYTLPGLFYWALGGGFELPLRKRMYLDLAFHNFLIINDVPKKFNYTQYIIGLNYHFGERL